MMYEDIYGGGGGEVGSGGPTSPSPSSGGEGGSGGGGGRELRLEPVIDQNSVSGDYECIPESSPGM